MQSDSMFRKFCYYVDEHIFSKENMGSYVAFVVNQSFIDDFCRENNTTEGELMLSVRNNHWRNNYDHFDAKGFVAIQLFAASKRAYGGGLTAKAYYARLSQVIGFDKDFLSKSWMPLHQDRIWSLLYRWCETNYYKITKSERREGPYCYVQYPLTQAKRVFTEEDLLYIAKCFVDKRLFPEEDITWGDFWKLITKHSLSQYLITHHAIDVVNNSVNVDDYLLQIYNFYLRWDGKYKIREKNVRTESKLNGVYAYLTDDFETLELRNDNLQLLHCYSVENIKYHEVNANFPFRREGLLLFKKDDVYDNRWQEVRYIDADEYDYSKESGMYGIAVCFKNAISGLMEYKLRNCQTLLENRNICIYKITKRSFTSDFFTEKRIYELFGGLKIGRNSYLKRAAPILRLRKPSMVWIDGKALDENVIEGDYSLDFLEVGSHFIKMPNAKSINIDVVDTSASIVEWREYYNKWLLGKKPALWKSEKSEQGIIGLDFSSVSNTDLDIDENIIKRWAKAFAFGKYHKNENNTAINLTKLHNESI